MPTTRSPCPSTLATKQTTLLVPISRAAITSFLALSTMSPVLTLHFRFSWFRRSRRRLRIVGRASLPEIELVRQPQIDDAEFARQQLVVVVELDQSLEGRDGVLLRQPDLDLLLQDQVPAALADPYRGAQLARDGGFIGKQQQEIADMLGRTCAAQQQERIRARRHAARAHGAAVLVDQSVFLAVLPDRDGTAFLQRHVECVRQTARDGRARHPVDRLEPAARRLQV